MSINVCLTFVIHLNHSGCALQIHLTVILCAMVFITVVQLVTALIHSLNVHMLWPVTSAVWFTNYSLQRLINQKCYDNYYIARTVIRWLLVSKKMGVWFVQSSIGRDNHVEVLWFCCSGGKIEGFWFFRCSSRFLWGRPPSSCSGVSEGLLRRVRGQSERCDTQQPACNPGLPTERGGIAFIWHHSAAPKCSTHRRNCKSLPERF